MECHSVTGLAPRLSRGLVALRASMPALHGVLGMPLLVPAPISMRRTSPGTDRPLAVKPVSISRAPLLLRVPSFQLPPEPFRTQAPPAKVSALFAASPKTSNSAIGTQPTACSALRLSQPLDGFLRLRLRGLIPSRGHVQGLLSKGFSLRAATLLRQEEIPPCR